MLSRRSGAFDATLSSLIFSFGFIATKWAIAYWSPLATVSLRLAIGATGGLILALVMRQLPHVKSHLKVAFVPGLLISADLLCLAAGLRVTTVSNGVFISSIYVVLIPFMSGFKIFSLSGLRHLSFVALALLGMAFITDFSSISLSTQGDLLCLFSAICNACYIVTLERSASRIKSPLAFNAAQLLWGSLITGICCLFLPHDNPMQGSLPMAIVGILIVGILSSSVATWLQIRGQLKIGALAASLFCLLDAPFATLFGILILSEHLTVYKVIGAMIIVTASAGQFYFDLRKKKRAEAQEQASATSPIPISEMLVESEELPAQRRAAR